jgi:hypothetical protein
VEARAREASHAVRLCGGGGGPRLDSVAVGGPRWGCSQAATGCSRSMCGCSELFVICWLIFIKLNPVVRNQTHVFL